MFTGIIPVELSKTYIPIVTMDKPANMGNVLIMFSQHSQFRIITITWRIIEHRAMEIL
jgi:hypothetical protein